MELNPYISGAAAGLLPPPPLTLSQWAADNFYLSAESSAAPGLFRAFPYQVGIMDAFTDPFIEYITWMKSARVGYTTVLTAYMAFHMVHEPCSQLIVQPTLGEARGFSKENIEPMVRDVPALRGAVAKPKSRSSDNTILRKQFAGGFLELIGANSGAGFRRRTVRLVLFDEIDGYPPPTDEEGDQIERGIDRSESFWNRKIAFGSTPTTKELSRIEPSFNESDKRYYYINCPTCGHAQRFVWSQMKWPQNNPERAYYQCEDCEKAIDHKHKRRLIEDGDWVATAPEVKGHAGFHIWGAYSLHPNSTWPKLAARFLKVKDNPTKLKTFVNTVLGETTDDPGEEIESITLIDRAERFETRCPAAVKVITAGVDVQKGRLELEIVGWDAGNESWSLDYVILYGDPAREDVWKQLDEHLARLFNRADGAMLKIAAMGIDSGYSTTAVYSYCKAKEKRRVYALKGSNQMSAPIASRPSRKGVQKVLLYTVGTDTAKDDVFTYMETEKPGPGFCHFPDSRPEEYFKQLTAEKRVPKYIKGVKFRQYVKTRPRNEALDCRVYAYAALCILNPIWERIKKQMAPRAEPPEPAAPAADQRNQGIKKHLPGKRRRGFVKNY